MSFDLSEPTHPHNQSNNVDTSELHHGKPDSYFSSSPAPQSIGPYKLLQRIGAGGMGEVWVADQAEPVKRRVAIKLIKEGIGSKEIIARFDAERQALALMNHPNISRILDAGTTPEGQPFFAMELVQGQPLTTFCDENRLSIDERLKLFADVCSGVQHAHQKGIIHRDLKPGNILVTFADGNAVPKVIDFGLAKALESTQRLTDQSLFTGIGQILGTLKYMSPEQASLNSIDIDTRTDIYALGVILYELLTGSTPLDDTSIRGRAALKILEFIRDKEPVKPSSKLGSSTDEQVLTITGRRKTDSVRLNRVLAGDLDWIVMKALEKDRTRRYETASAFAEDIRRYLNGEVIQACPPSIGYRIRKYVGRNKGIVISSGIVAGLVILSLVTTTWLWRDSVAAKKNAEDATAQIQLEKENVEREKRNVEAERDRADLNEKIAKNEAERLARSEQNQRIQADKLRFQQYSTALSTAFSHQQNGKLLAAERTLLQTPVSCRNWEYAHVKGQIQRTLEIRTQSAGVESTAISKDGMLIATGGNDGKIRIWNVKSRQLTHVLKAHDGEITAITFDSDVKRLASAGLDGSIRIWDLATQKQIASKSTQNQAIDCARRMMEEIAWREKSDEVLQKYDKWVCDIVDEFGAGYDRSLARIKIFEQLPVWKLLRRKQPESELLVGIIDRAFRDSATSVIKFMNSEPNLLLTHSRQSGLVKWHIMEDREDRSYPASDVAALSSDGKLLATRGYNKTTLWNVDNDEQVTDLPQQNGRIFSYSFSADNRHLLCAGDQLDIWDLQSSKLIRTEKIGEQRAISSTFAPDGSSVVVGTTSGELIIWNWENSEVTRHHAVGRVETVVITDQPTPIAIAGTHLGHLLFVPIAKNDTNVRLVSDECPIALASRKNSIASRRDSRIRICNAETLEEETVYEGEVSEVKFLSFSKNERYLVALSFANSIRVWDTSNGTVISNYELTKENDFSVNGIAVDDSSNRLYLSSRNGKVRVKNLKNGSDIAEISADSGWLNGIELVGEEPLLMTRGGTEGIDLWDSTYSRENNTSFRQFYSHTGHAELSDGYLTVATNDGIEILNIQTNQVVMTFKGNSFVNSFCFSRDRSRLFAACGSDILVWDTTSGVLVMTLKAQVGSITRIAISTTNSILAFGQNAMQTFPASVVDGTYIVDDHFNTISVISQPGNGLVATGSKDRRILIRESEYGTTLKTFSMSSGIAGVEYIEKLNAIVGANQDGELVSWDLNTGLQIAASDRRTHLVLNCLLAHPNDELLVAAGHSKDVEVIDANTLQISHSFPLDIAGNCLAFSPNGNLVLVGTAQGIYVWSWSSRNLMAHRLQSSRVTQLGFDSSNRLLALNDGKLSFLDSSSFELINDVGSGQTEIHCFAISRSRRRVAVAFDDRIAILDTDSNTEIRSVPVTGRVRAIVYSADESKLFVAIDTALLIWSQHGDDLLVTK